MNAPTQSFCVLSAIVAIGIPVAACAQEAPGFDCKLARTQVERVLCAGGNSGMGWLDQTMENLYKAVRQSSGATNNTLQQDQRLWLARRNRCSGTDTHVMNCLDQSYRSRFEAIAAPYDAQRLTGSFASERTNGTLIAVLFPDASLAVAVSANSGAPAYNACGLTFRAPVHDGAVTYKPANEENIGAGECTFSMTVSRAQIVVAQNGCVDFCGNGVSLGGTYSRSPQ